MAHSGVDLSSYQGEITPGQVALLKEAGVEFAYVKLTQGDGYTNPDAVQQCNALRAAGILVGYYHFFDDTATAGSQAQYFLIVAAAHGPTPLPLALDSEEPENWDALASSMMNFVMQIEAEPTVVQCAKALLYVNLNFYENLPGFPWGRLVWLADPNPGAPHKPCLVLQSAPRPEGGFSSIDPDTFVGTDEQWQAFITPGATPVVTPNSPKPPVPAPAPKPVPAPQPQEFDMATLPTLSVGSSGEQVRAAQCLLRWKFNQVGVLIDGDFGPVTEAAVKAVQDFFKLTVNGEVGPDTWGALITL